jgi:hypothetical protein
LKSSRRAFRAKSVVQPRRIYSITPAGQDRFMTLMLTDAEYSRDTPKLFIIKLTKFQFLNTHATVKGTVLVSRLSGGSFATTIRPRQMAY